MKKSLLFILVFFILFLCGCSLFPTNKTESTDFREKIYKLAADSGYEGTYEEWLESIAGDQVELIVDEEGNLKWKYASEKNADYRFLFSMTSLQGTNGEDGNGIEKIELTSSEDLNDTYTITYTNGTTSTFVVKNGAKGEPGHTPEIKIGENGNWFVDDKDTGVASNIKGDTGNGIEKIELSSQEGLKDTYKITFTNGVTYTFDVNNGAKGDTGNGITKIELTGEEYPIYTYTVYYTDGSTFAYQVTSGLSAYELYKNAHADYTKTESEFLSDLVNGRLADKETFTVKFNTNCDETIEDVVVNKLDKVSKPSEPKKDGYTFLGWFVEDEKWLFSGCVVTENMTLEAKWQANTYTITYDANGGEVAPPSQSILFDNEFILQSPTKDGYRFGGWFYGDTLVENGVYKYAKDITLTAKWNPLYTIVLNSNGGTTLENIAVTGSRTINSLPTPTRDADRFLGWYFNDELVELPFTYNGNNTEIEFVALWKEVAGDYEFIALDDSSVKITKYNGTDTDIIIPNVINGKDVVELETSLFEGNASINKITLQSNIKTIGNNAFANMPALQEVVFNAGIDNYGENLLLGSSNLMKITIEAYSEMLISFYDFDETNIPSDFVVTLIYTDRFIEVSNGIFKNMTGISSINVILDETWSVITGFSGCESLKSISISSTVTRIGNNDGLGFYGCINLEAVYVDDINTWLQIDQNDGPMRYAHNLYINGELVKNLIIPEGITSIKDNSLSGCLSLETIVLPSTITSIGSCALSGCRNLRYLVIPDSVTSLGDQALSSCDSISTLVIPSSLTNVNSYALNNMIALEAVYYKGTRAQWFQYFANDYLNGKDLHLEFETEVSSLSIVKEDDLSYIITDKGNIHGLHLDNKNIVDCVIPDGISVIPNSMFYECRTLQNVLLPNSLEIIEDQAFFNCSSLLDIVIPDNVRKIGDDAFSGCISLHSLIIPDTVTEIGSFMDGNCFQNWKNLTIISIPNGVARINNNAFEGCTSLTSITIPNSVISIGSYAFSRCTSLTSITIPESVTTIGDSAFYACTSLTKVNILNLEKWTQLNFDTAYANPLYYAHNLYLNGELVTSLTIPESVTNIGNNLFCCCESLTNVTIPDNVIEIGEDAFYECTSLTSITIGNGVKSTGSHAFHGCTSLTNITIGNGVESIDNYAFFGCTSLTSITIPESVTTINSSAFGQCKLLTNITIPDSVTSIGNNAFDSCISLESISIPASVTSIGNYAFSWCSSLKNIEIFNGIISIGEQAFDNCSALTSITVPNSVTSLGKACFYSCYNLESIVLSKNISSIQSDTFNSTQSLQKIYFLGSETEWNSITVEAFNQYLDSANIYFYSENEPTDAGNWWYYDTDGTTIIKKII